MLGVLALAGCDGSVDANDTSVTYRGRVTTESQTSNSLHRLQQTAEVVADAEVRAYLITDDGTSVETGAVSTTDASGTYSLTLDQEASFVLLTASKGSFSSQVVAYRQSSDGDIVDVAPMTAETDAEAEVYLEARKQASTDDDAEGAVTLADVALYVDASVAADLAANSTTAAEIAAALRAGREAEEAYADEAAEDEGTTGDAPSKDRREAARAAYAVLQARLAAATTAEAATDAYLEFEEAMIALYDESRTNLAIQAQARQTGRVAMERETASLSADTRFALEQEAALEAAVTTAMAIEDAFEASGAGSARLTALANARAALLTDLRAATSFDALAEAQAAYESAVESELAAELNVSVSLLNTARSAASTARTSLQAALSTAVTAQAIAQAHLSYFAAATSAIASSLEASSNASLGAEVLVLLTLQ
ncbi:hypothetical protein AWN76_004605 [Rhodothermaceae bacterium RA]|nr:hypothetical protein AWN76_004605 [Rhodothermaceae bacterium RA]